MHTFTFRQHADGLFYMESDTVSIAAAKPEDVAGMFRAGNRLIFIPLTEQNHVTIWT